MVQKLYFIAVAAARTVGTMDRIDKLAAEIATAAAPHAQRHDQDGTFVSEGVDTARDLGYLAAPVPPELGGEGARTADIAAAQQVIARSCGSTGLACAMHLHVVLAAAWRWRRGDTVVEPLLRKVAADRLIVASTGGKDWTHPTTVATATDGGWRVRGRKTFASISPAAGAVATFAVVDEARPGADVLVFGCPLTAEGVTLVETWDAAGMRGTGSHDLVFDDVFVAHGQVTGHRTWGELDKPLLLASVHAWPVIAATYLGVADGLTAAALRSATDEPADIRLAGLLDAQVRSARWALDGALADLGDDPEPTFDNFVMLQQMKRIVTLAGLDIADAAAEVAGGRAYARRGPIDRMIRDLRAAMYHPCSPEATLHLAGGARLARARTDDRRDVTPPAPPGA
jgi:alkylation response protein AidB-like acyl-CoA dehydrogenase